MARFLPRLLRRLSKYLELQCYAVAAVGIATKDDRQLLFAFAAWLTDDMASTRRTSVNIAGICGE
jgi:hypothetical protein